jgi:hypothetical protein
MEKISSIAKKKSLLNHKHTRKEDPANLQVDYQIQKDKKLAFIDLKIYDLTTNVAYIHVNYNVDIDATIIEDYTKYNKKANVKWIEIYQDNPEKFLEHLTDYYIDKGFNFITLEFAEYFMSTHVIRTITTGDTLLWVKKIFPDLETTAIPIRLNKLGDCISVLQTEHSTLNKMGSVELNSFMQQINSLECKIRDILARYPDIDLKTLPIWNDFAKHFTQPRNPYDSD